MNLGIEGKTALVIGASRGIGRAVAIALAREGCKVLAVAKNVDGLATLQHEQEMLAVHAIDLMIPDAVHMMIGWAGICGQPDIIYHAMGGSLPGIKDWDRPASEYQQVWNFNLGIAHDINRVFIPGMVQRGWGRVVHTSTDGVKNGCGNVPYTSSKGAVEAYVELTGRKFAGTGVVVSAVAPGPTDNGTGWLYTQPPEVQQAYQEKYVPMRRWATPEEVAKQVVFQCSEHASYMAGAVMAVDGGIALMFQHQGIWLPDGEKHFPDWMTKNGEIVDGRGTYQIKKFREAMKWCVSFCTAIDVGAHVGLWSMQLVKRFECVEAFEPVYPYRECFALNVPEHDGQLHNVALGAERRRVGMIVPTLEGGLDTGGTHVVHDDKAGIEMRPLDDFDFQAVDFIKIDCEGYEEQVIKGGEKMIRANRPCIIVEQKPHKLSANYGVTGTPAVDLLKAWSAKVRAELGGDFILSWD